MNDMPTHAFLLEDLPDVADWLRKLLQARFPGIQVTMRPVLPKASAPCTARRRRNWRWWIWDYPMAMAPH